MTKLKPIRVPAPVKVVKNIRTINRGYNLAYGYWFVSKTRTEYLFDRRYKLMAARNWDDKFQQVSFHPDEWIKGISAQCYFFADGVTAEMPMRFAYDRFVQGYEVRHLFVTSNWSFIWPDLMEVEARGSTDGALLRAYQGAKDVTTLPLKPVEDWLR